jgi:hypothetical protein
MMELLSDRQVHELQALSKYAQLAPVEFRDSLQRGSAVPRRQ